MSFISLQDPAPNSDFGAIDRERLNVDRAVLAFIKTNHQCSLRWISGKHGWGEERTLVEMRQAGIEEYGARWTEREKVIKEQYEREMQNEIDEALLKRNKELKEELISKYNNLRDKIEKDRSLIKTLSFWQWEEKRVLKEAIEKQENNLDSLEEDVDNIFKEILEDKSW